MNNVKELQYQLNLQSFTDADGNKLVVDGIVGPKTLQACDKCTVQIGASGGITRWIQNTLIYKGYSLAPYGADGIVGQVTLNAVKQFQGCSCIPVDGIVGPLTWRALLDVVNYCVMALQHQLNVQGFTDADGNKLIVDGIVGPKTLQACDKCTVQIGASGEITRWIQNQLVCRGYNLSPYGADGVFGQVTLNAVKQFQAKNGLTADGIVGTKTWRALL